MSKKILSFNTGRGYTEHGQRIAASQLDNGCVVFVDIDRGIRYVTSAPCELTQRAVMRAYDYNETGCEWAAIPDHAMRDRIIGELEAAARAVQGVRS